MFVRILDCEITLDKKQIQAIFLFEFKMGHKTEETTRKSSMHVARELIMSLQCSGGSRSFAKEMRALKMRRAVATHWKLTKTTERVIEADPLTAM